MPDDKTKRSRQDRTRIDISEDYELRDWSEKFGVSKERLKEAVKAVGDKAADVQNYLKGQKAEGLISQQPYPKKPAKVRAFRCP